MPTTVNIKANSFTKTSLFLLILLFNLGLFAQNQRGTGKGNFDPSQIPAIGKLSLKIIDGASSKPLEFAALQIKHSRDSNFISVGLSDEKGNISVDQIKIGKIYISIKYVGYLTYRDTIKLIPPNNELDLGSIKMMVNEKIVKEATVTGQKAEMELAIDKKIFNIANNPIIQGGSALDALKQVPTINVDVDGKISLRGSEGVQIYINGKPSGMNGANRGSILEQYPASNIQSVEIISNPSAKYDAEGMSGIINIVTKQVLTESNSGSVQAGIGTNNKYNLSLNQNYRKGKFSSSNTLSGRYNQNWMEGYSNRDNFLTGNGILSSTINQSNTGQRKNLNGTFSGSTEYRFTDKQSLSLTYSGSLSKKENPEDFKFNFIDNASGISQLYNRYTLNPGNNQNVDASLNYTNYIKKGEKELTGAVSFSNSDEKSFGDFTQKYFLSEGRQDTSKPILFQHNNSRNQFRVITSQLDYLYKLKNGIKLETGLKSTIRHTDNDLFFDQKNDSTGQFEVNKFRTNHFIYDESVWAAYLNGSYSYKDWGLQAGLRGEQTYQQGTVMTTNQGFKREYFQLFPSIFLKRSFKNSNDVQISYTRRINRPGIETLNPFADYADYPNLRVGNPYVKPELTDALELSYSKQWQAHSLIVTGYFRQINGAIQRIRTVDSQGVVATVMPVNINYAQNIGLEVIGRSRITKWWVATTNFNAFQNIINGKLANNASEASNLFYGGRIANNFKIPNIMDAQVSYQIMGPMIMPSGRMREMQGLDIGLKKDFKKGKFSVNLNLEDAFNTRRFLLTTGDYNYSGLSYRKRETRILRVNLTWKFGKATSNSEDERKTKKPNSGEGGTERDMGM